MEVPLRRLFELPTPEGLARVVEELRGVPAEAPPMRQVPRGGDLPLSFAQERLWLIDRLEPGSPVYNIPAVVLLEGDLEVAALRRAFATVAARHEALRTSFREAGGRPFQVVAPSLPVRLPLVDLGCLPEAARADEVLRLSANEALSPFDLAGGPLLRASLVRCRPGEHRLLLTLHHIVADGWSMGILVREVNVLYGSEPKLSPLPLQYPDFAAWQREWLQGEVLERQLAWWRQRLGGAPAALDLATDSSRPAAADRRGAACSRELAQPLWAAVEALSRRAGATPFLVVLAALQALLARYTSAEDLTVGTPVAGRTCREAEELIGLFVNTLVLRADLSRDPSFGTLLSRAREEMLGAHAHQHLPFERLVEELAERRDLGRTPLFQVMLAFGNVPMPPLELPGLRLSALEPEARTSKFDLTFSFTPRAEGALLRLIYRTDLFDRTMAERMAGHLATLLDGAAKEPELRLSELPLLGEAERRELAELNWTRRNDPPDGTLHAAFAAQVRRTPDALAVAAGSRSLSFAELDRRAAAVAAHLRRLGVGPEVRVGLSGGRSPEAIAGILGILKAGGAYVPVDPSWPAERVSCMLEDSEAALLLTDEAIAEAREESSVLPWVSPDGAAYVIYTSGSTGKPKGVVVRHRSVLNLAQALRETVYPSSGPLRVAVNASLSFDGSVKQLVQLLSGHSLHPVPDEVRLDPSAMREWLRRERIDVLDVTPSQLRPLLEAGLSAPRWVLVGGEALDQGTWRAARSCPSTRFFNVYGPTECTVDATVADIAQARVPAAIGAPLPNVRVYLMDRWGQPVPAGVPGELWIGGEGVARGYLGHPGLTAERFVPDPFGGHGSRLYRSGDRACLRSGGEIEYFGRIDRQLKIRGYRVEPGEVEAALRELPEVKDAAVLARDGRLVAYLTGELSVASVKRSLERRLPSYLIPSSWVLLERLPLTASGKIDHGALPEPDADRSASGDLRTPAEELLAGIFVDLLGTASVGREDDFFALGGHSLLATQVVSRLREPFGVELPLRAVFESPTVAGLASTLAALAKEGAGPAAPPMRPVPRDGNLPLSFSQQRLWFLDRLDAGNPAYNIPMAVLLEGELDVQALRRALQGLVERHEVLRTTFRAAGGRPVQVIAPRLELALPLVELGDEAEARQLAEAEALRPFDLEAGPLLRTVLIRLERRRHVLLVTLHHVVSDGWSTGVLVRDLTALYRGTGLPPLPVQYADYAVWQREWLAGSALEPRLAWWRERLQDLPPSLALPVDRPRLAVAGHGGAACRISF
ncbi:MAG TPA: amino acid adenylation domain-containing protein, partial [Thermoanaerobaculia bacterium]|nr:amino acid adenylation domain-containing protein [Thermoanaerobaculia bacterium]